MKKLIKMFALGLLCCTAGIAATCSTTVNVKNTGVVDPASVEVGYDCLKSGYKITWQPDPNETPTTFSVDFGDNSTSPCLDSQGHRKSNFTEKDKPCTVKEKNFPTASHGCKDGDPGKAAVCLKYNVSADGHPPKDPQVIVDQSNGGFYGEKN